MNNSKCINSKNDIKMKKNGENIKIFNNKKKTRKVGVLCVKQISALERN